MKLAIVTAVFGDSHTRLSKLSAPIMRQYASQIGAELIVLQSRRFVDRHPYWEKMQIRDVLKVYDRVAWVDVDVIIHPRAPSIFDACPPESFGAFDEGKVFVDRVNCLPAEAFFYGIPIRPNHRFTYFNSGVMVVDKSHEGIFVQPKCPAPNSIMPDQTYLNLMLQATDSPFVDLTSKWNGLHSIHGRSDRQSLWTVHYAGYPKTADWVDRVIAEMRVDLAGFR
jgi:lipopolysaccharide biosynthesis glycosyltransferase